MCGIFGICYQPESGLTAKEVNKILNHLFRYSQSRGKEASGLLMNIGGELSVYKDTIKGNNFIKTAEYKALFKKLPMSTSNNMIIGHARLDTNGSKWDNTNNSPIDYESISGIHNGIVANVDQLWDKHPDLERKYVVDSEVLFALFSKGKKQGKTEADIFSEIYNVIEGSASVALYSTEDNRLSLATNTGSLYFTHYSDDLFIFASEQYILEQLHKKMSFLKRFNTASMHQITPQTSLSFDINSPYSLSYKGRLVHEVL